MVINAVGKKKHIKGRKYGGEKVFYIRFPGMDSFVRQLFSKENELMGHVAVSSRVMQAEGRASSKVLRQESAWCV